MSRRSDEGVRRASQLARRGWYVALWLERGYATATIASASTAPITSAPVSSEALSAAARVTPANTISATARAGLARELEGVARMAAISHAPTANEQAAGWSSGISAGDRRKQQDFKGQIGTRSRKWRVQVFDFKCVSWRADSS